MSMSPHGFWLTVVSAFVALGVGGCAGAAKSPETDQNKRGQQAASSATPDHNSDGANTNVSSNTPVPWRVEDFTSDDFTVEEGFRTLRLTDFEVFAAKPLKDGAQTWSSIANVIVCTGKPKGYLYTTSGFRDFTLRLEFRFAPPAEGVATADFNPNTGVLVYITEPHKQWPKSLEVQGKFSELATIKPNGGAANVEIEDDATARESARKPIGEWNSLEIVSKAGALTTVLNGTKICESRPGELSSGAIGLQSEDFEVHFRRIRIRGSAE
jgi:3-keto-disaccharide hydrolase